MGLKLGLGIGVRAGVRPSRYFYLAANGAGNGRSLESPAAWSHANFGDAIDSGKIIRLVGPAANAGMADAKRADEFPSWSAAPEANYNGWKVHDSGRPVFIESIGHPSNPTGRATFCSNRNGWTLPSDAEAVTDISAWTAGGYGFNIQAPQVTIRNVFFRRMGSSVLIDTDNVAHELTLDRLNGYNIERMLNMMDFITAHDGHVIGRGSAPADWDIGYSKGCYRVMGASARWLFENMWGNSGRQSQGSFARFIYANNTAVDWELRDCYGYNAHSTLTGYWNGDSGFECNGRNRGRLIRVGGFGATDGGIDVKGEGYAEDLVSGGNKRNVRCWGPWEFKNLTTISPKNRGDTANGRCHFYGNGIYPADADQGHVDPLNGWASSQDKCDAIIDGWNITTTDQDADTKLVFLGTAGAILRVLDPVIIDGVAVGDFDPAQLTLVAGTKLIRHQGSKLAADIGCAILTPLTQSAPEGGLIKIKLTATAAGLSGGVYDKCTWRLDLNHPGVQNNTVTLDTWARHDPTLTFVAPPAAGGGKLEINITCVDGAGNHITALLTVNSTAVTMTQTPLIAGFSDAVGTKTASTLTVVKPATGVFENDMLELTVRSNAASVDHPTVTGGGTWTRIEALDNSQATSPVSKSWTFVRRAGPSEPANYTVSFWSDAGETTASTPVSNTSSHTARLSVVRYAKTSDPAYELPAKTTVSQPSFQSTPPAYYEMPTAGPSLTPAAGNRLAMQVIMANNDLKDDTLQEVSPSTPGYAVANSQVYNGANTGDMTFVTALQDAPTVQAYAGPKLRWAGAGQLRPAHLVSALLWCPRQDPT